MLKPTYSTQFGKDIKRVKKRGKSQEKIKKILKKLINEQQLPKSCKDHNWELSRQARMPYRA